jgi:Bacterial Ig-like domain (group 2)
MMLLKSPRRGWDRSTRHLAVTLIEILEERVLLADGISASPGLHFLGRPGVALSNVAVATFVVTNPSGGPGTKWDSHINWGDGNVTKKIQATAGPNNTFQFMASHTYASAGTYTITVMIAVPGSHKPNDNTVTTQAVITSASLESIAVTPANPKVPKGLTERFTATGTYSDKSKKAITTQVTWASSNTKVATISNTSGSQGLATAVAIGTSTISAKLSGITGSTVLMVT